MGPGDGAGAVVPVGETLRDAAKAGPRKLWGAFRHLLDYRLRTTLSQVHCPVLVVRGADDPLVPRAVVRRFADIAQRGRHAEIPGCHAVPYTSPDDLAHVVLEIDPSSDSTIDNPPATDGCRPPPGPGA